MPLRNYFDGEEGFVYQDVAPLKSFEGKYPVIGSWVIGIRKATRRPSPAPA
jgi:glutathionylspermidine synthase